MAGWLPEDSINASIPNNIHGTGNGFSDFVWDTASAGGGNGSLLIRGRGIRVPEREKRSPFPIDRVLSMKMPVKGGTEYRLTFDYRAEGMGSNPSAPRERCEFIVVVTGASGPFQPGFMSHIGLIRDRWNVNDPIPGRLFDPPTKLVPFDREFKEDASEWTRCSYTFTTPSDATKVELRPWVECMWPAHPFAVWFDNFEIEAVQPDDSVPAAPAVPATWKPRTLPPRTERGLMTGEPELLPPAIPYGSRIPRTMKLLATSTPEHRHRVRILCYGQSVIAQPWWYKIYGDLKRQYPHADLVMTNTSLGGFMSDNLRLSAETDLYPEWPDLVLLHDYVADGEAGAVAMEQIYASLRARTTSEMLTYTFHSSFPGNYAKPNMYVGFKKHHDADSALVRTLADRYGYEVVEARANWEKTVQALFPDLDFRFAINWFLFDQIHTNLRGQRFYHYLSMPHFAYRPADKSTWLDTIRVYASDGTRWPQTGDEYPTDGRIVAEPVRFAFTGSRIDLIAQPTPGKPGSAKILLDGKPPSADPSVYVSTRAESPWANITWPLVIRAQVGAKPVAEEWTLTYTRVDASDASFQYEVRGSVTGPDGSGDSRARFVSNSGRLVLDPESFLSPRFTSVAKYPAQAGKTVTWRCVPIARDVWTPQGGADPSLEDRAILAQGIANGPHVLEIIPNGDGPLGLRAFVVHQPPVVAIPKSLATPVEAETK